MSDQTLPIDPIVDPYGYLGMVRHSDGSITRLQQPASFPVDTPNEVVIKDLAINPSKNTWARIILPRQVLGNTSKIPLLIYFHGGGFVVATVDTPSFQAFYASVATETPAILVSIEYRRAPEDPLPAAYEDCIEALHWIKNGTDEWLANYTDFSRCFLMGSSAGANVAYHVGLHAAQTWDNLKPLAIKGVILHQPFFGGKDRTQSELRLSHDKILPLNVCDIMWELALPQGAHRDHDFSNPIVGIQSNPQLFDKFKLLGWKMLVTGCHGDPLIDRQIGLAKVLKEMGVQVVGRFTQGGFHGIEFAHPFKTKEFSVALKEFVTAL